MLRSASRLAATGKLSGVARELWDAVPVQLRAVGRRAGAVGSCGTPVTSVLYPDVGQAWSGSGAAFQWRRTLALAALVIGLG